MPLVSVIMPTRNRADLLGRSIRSVLAQTFRDFELIIIDDNSSDNTGDMVKSFNDDRIIYDRLENNKGAAGARNRGLSLAKGKYVAFQDDDDEWLPEKLEKQVMVLNKSTDPALGIVYSNMWEVDKDSVELTRPNRIMPEDGIVFNDALFGKLKSIGIQTALIRREVFDKIGGFDESFPRWIDHEFFIRASRYFLFYHVNAPLVKWHTSSGGIASVKMNKIIAMKMLLTKYAEDYNKAGNKMLLAGYYYDLGHDLCLQGYLKEGRSFLLKSIGKNPMHINAWIAAFFSFTHPSVYKLLHPL